MNLKIETYTYQTCMVCGSDNDLIYENLEDRHFGNSENWKLCQCKNKECGLLWLNPMPTKEDIGKAYQEYYTHSDKKPSVLDFRFLQKPYYSIKYGYYPEINLFQKALGLLVYLLPTLKEKLDFNILYLPAFEKGKILDYGCGSGEFLDRLKEKGWDTYGLDVDPKAIQHCQSKGLKANLGDIASHDYPDNYFDVITINHVIEHVHDVDILVQKCREILKPNGKLIIATPNTESWQHSKYKENWLQLDPPRHLHIFNIGNLEKVIIRNSFSIEKSFSSSRIDAWSAIVSRSIRRDKRFKIGIDKKRKSDLFIGLFEQFISLVKLKFNKKAGGELIIIARK